MHHCLKTLLKLFAPYLPHVTEEIYSCLFVDDNNLVTQRNSWPSTSEFISDNNSEQLGDALVNILEAIRKTKASEKLSVSYPITNLYISPSKSNLDISSILDDLSNVSKSVKISMQKSKNMSYTEDELFLIQCEFADEKN